MMSGRPGMGHSTLPDGWDRDGRACGALNDEGLDPFAVYLSPTQRTVAVLIAMGHKMPSIAKLLGLSIKTVSTHRSDVMTKLRCANNVELARLAIVHKRVPHP